MSVAERKRLPAPLVLDGLNVVVGPARARRPASAAAVGGVKGSAVPLILGQFFCARRRDDCGCGIQASALGHRCVGPRWPTQGHKSGAKSNSVKYSPFLLQEQLTHAPRIAAENTTELHYNIQFDPVWFSRLVITIKKNTALVCFEDRASSQS